MNFIAPVQTKSIPMASSLLKLTSSSGASSSGVIYGDFRADLWESMITIDT